MRRNIDLTVQESASNGRWLGRSVQGSNPALALKIKKQEG